LVGENGDGAMEGERRTKQRLWRCVFGSEALDGLDVDGWDDDPHLVWLMME
jgi:hypothetical protein